MKRKSTLTLKCYRILIVFIIAKSIALHQQITLYLGMANDVFNVRQQIFRDNQSNLHHQLVRL